MSDYEFNKFDKQKKEFWLFNKQKNLMIDSPFNFGRFLED